ncbi:MAG: hypothetical protein WC617_17550 [Rhodanobacter sp.]|jgi:hypothetical protein
MIMKQRPFLHGYPKGRQAYPKAKSQKAKARAKSKNQRQEQKAKSRALAFDTPHAPLGFKIKIEKKRYHRGRK